MSEQQTNPEEQPTTPPPAGAPGMQPEAADQVSKDTRNLGMLCHILALAGYVVPFGNIIGPLVVWLMKKDSDPFVDEQGKEAINFQITITLAIIVCAILFFLIIPLLLIPVIGIFDLIMIILAAVKASSGEHYRYPLTLRLIK